MNVVMAYENRIQRQYQTVSDLKAAGREVPKTLLADIERNKRMIRKCKGEQV